MCHHVGSAGLEKVKEAYLPFYVMTASLRSELASAELGFQEWGTVFNPTRRRFERQLVVTWRPAVFDVVCGWGFIPVKSAVILCKANPRSRRLHAHALTCLSSQS